MAISQADVLKMIKDKEVKFVDLRFTDTKGKEQHVSVPSKVFTQDKFDNGHAFDGSSIAGWTCLPITVPPRRTYRSVTSTASPVSL